MENKKYDRLMLDITSGKLEGKWSDIMDRVEAVLEEEKMGTLNDMMFSIKSFLEKHNKLDPYINDKGDFQPPFELVFSWFNKAVTEHRKQNNTQQ